jgi:hypothetical protein
MQMMQHRYGFVLEHADAQVAAEIATRGARDRRPGSLRRGECLVQLPRDAAAHRRAIVRRAPRVDELLRIAVRGRGRTVDAFARNLHRLFQEARWGLWHFPVM